MFSNGGRPILSVSVAHVATRPCTALDLGVLFSMPRITFVCVDTQHAQHPSGSMDQVTQVLAWLFGFGRKRMHTALFRMKRASRRIGLAIVAVPGLVRICRRWAVSSVAVAQAGVEGMGHGPHSGQDVEDNGAGLGNLTGM